MIKRAEKKEYIRKQIVDASRIYRDQLAGKVFLYVIGTDYFEVAFQSNCFMHLTGVDSRLNAKSFYSKASSSKLTTEQFFFSSDHSYQNAKKKLPCLMTLPKLTTSDVIAVRNLRTLTLTYKIGVTNLDFTIGLTENIDRQGSKINDWFLPRTLRVKDKAFENSEDAEAVDFIFSKNASSGSYDTLCFSSSSSQIPENIKHPLSVSLLDELHIQTKELHPV